MRAIDAAEELLAGRTRVVGTAYSQTICECRPPVSENEVAGRLMELLWEEAVLWMEHWRSTKPPVSHLKECGHLWVLERTVKCRWRVARQIARQLLDEATAAKKTEVAQSE